MPLGISTHIFITERLSPGHLDLLEQAGADSIEVFASRHHFNYGFRNAIRDIAGWFASHPLTPTMHMPLFTEEEEADWSRHTAPTLNLISRDKRHRITAMDEVKRALEAAEQIPFRSCILHLGLKDDRWSTETLDLSLTAIEHLKAFANPLGVQLLLENLPNDFATPAHLLEICRVGHFNGLGFCLDLGHAHLAQPTQPDETGYDRLARERLRDQWGDAALRDGIPEAFQIFTSAGAERLVETHLHDNNGTRDEHLWPGEVSSGKGVDWGMVKAALASRDNPVRHHLEIAYDPAPAPGTLNRNMASTRKLLNLEKA